MKSNALLVILVPLIVVAYFVVTWLIQISWNHSIAEYLQLPLMTFTQAWWLNTLSFLLFRNIPFTSKK